MKRLRSCGMSVMSWKAVLGLSIMFLAVTIGYLAGTGRKIYTVQSLLLHIMGGAYDLEEINTIDTLKWLLLIVPWLIIVAKRMEMETNRRCAFVLIRLGSYSRWWSKLCGNIVVAAILYSLMGIVIISAFCLLNGVWGVDLDLLLIPIVVPVLLSIFLIMNVLLMTVLHITTGKPTISMALMLLVVLTAFVPDRFGWGLTAWLPGSWGMAWRAAHYRETLGFNIITILLIEILICAILYVIGHLVIRRREIAAMRVSR